MRGRLVGRHPKTTLLIALILLLVFYAGYCSLSESNPIEVLAESRLIYQVKVVPPVFRNVAFREYTLQTIPHRDETVKDFRARYLATPKKPDAIFVLMPSYRDPLCNATITDMFRSCKHCDRVFVGLVLQLHFDKDEDKLCIGLEDSPYAKNVRVVYVGHKDAMGPVYGRLLAAKMWEGEEYLLGIDSHTDFVIDWDEKIVSDYRNVPNMIGTPGDEIREKWFNENSNYLFSTYPRAMVDGQDATVLENDDVPFICHVSFSEGEGNSRQKGFFTQRSNYHYTPRQNDGIILPSYLIGAGFIFGLSKILYDSPYDPYVPFLFIGEELSMNLQLWTRGWNYFVPPRNYLTHKYGGEHRSVYSDIDKTDKIKEASVQRVAYILGIVDTPPDDTRELDQFELGTVRTLEEWEVFSGIHIKNQTFDERCGWIYNYRLGIWEKA